MRIGNKNAGKVLEGLGQGRGASIHGQGHHKHDDDQYQEMNPPESSAMSFEPLPEGLV